MFNVAQKVADAVLYEGYVLYPYRASARKNRARWQWGVVVPETAVGAGDTPEMQTEVLLEARDDSTLHVRLRFLQVQARTVEQDGAPVSELEVDGELLVTWEEGVEHAIDTELRLADLPAQIPIAVPGGREVTAVAPGVEVVRERWPVTARLLLEAPVLPGPYGVRKLRARIENLTPFASGDAPRDVIVRHALVATHTLLAIEGGQFLSLTDPPEWASGYATLCENLHTWPALLGDVVLSSPIILPDQAEIAPESPGDLFDALEIDEILTLRTMTLTDEEKREARATDPRAAAVIDRSDTLPPEILERLHGAIRSVRPTTGPVPQVADPGTPELMKPWWDPGMDASVSPATDRIWVQGTSVGKGSRVRLKPGTQRADAQDMFLYGRVGTVEAVFFSVDDDSYLAVTLEDQPEAAEIQRWHGRFLYFSPDEVEPL